MDVFVILLSIGALGGYLNKDGKQTRPQSLPRGKVSENDKPDAPLIYGSERKAQVDEMILEMAEKKYSSFLDQQFQGTQQLSVFPDPGQGEVTPAPLTLLNEDDSMASQFEKTRQQLLANKDTQVAPINPQTGNVQAQKQQDVFGGPMFHQWNFKSGGASSGAPVIEGFNGPVSQLNGLPWDGTHSNMQPNFKASNRRNYSDDMAGVMLERFSGAESGQDSWYPKQETKAQWNAAQSTKFAEITDVSDLRQRAQFAATQTSAQNYINPITQIKDSPINFKQTQVQPKNIDELFPNRAQTELSIRPNQGSSFTVRPMIPKPDKTFIAGDVSNLPLQGNRSAGTANMLNPTPDVRDNNATTSYEQSYMGPAVSQFKSYGYNEGMDAYKSRYDDVVSRKTETYTPRLGTAVDPQNKMPASSGTFIERATEKGIANTYIQPAYDGKGPRLTDNIQAPEPTNKDMLDVSNLSGKINRVDESRGAYTETNMDLPMTNKAMFAENKYLGAPFKNEGQGIRQHGFVALTTLKEMLHAPYSGNAKAPVSAPTDKNAQNEAYTDRTEKQTYIGAASVPVKSAPNQDGDFTTGLVSKPMLEGYYSGANKIDQKRQGTAEYAQTVDRDLTDKIDFGGRMGGGRSETMPLSRDGQIDIKEDTSAPGRLTVGVSYGAEQNPMGEMLLKEDIQEQVHYGAAFVKSTDSPAGVGIEIKTTNTATLNPRLDPDIKISNDLFPYV